MLDVGRKRRGEERTGRVGVSERVMREVESAARLERAWLKRPSSLSFKTPTHVSLLSSLLGPPWWGAAVVEMKAAAVVVAAAPVRECVASSDEEDEMDARPAARQAAAKARAGSAMLGV